MGRHGHGSASSSSQQMRLHAHEPHTPRMPGASTETVFQHEVSAYPDNAQCTEHQKITDGSAARLQIAGLQVWQPLGTSCKPGAHSSQLDTPASPVHSAHQHANAAHTGRHITYTACKRKYQEPSPWPEEWPGAKQARGAAGHSHVRCAHAHATSRPAADNLRAQQSPLSSRRAAQLHLPRAPPPPTPATYRQAQQCASDCASACEGVHRWHGASRVLGHDACKQLPALYAGESAACTNESGDGVELVRRLSMLGTDMHSARRAASRGQPRSSEDTVQQACIGGSCSSPHGAMVQQLLMRERQELLDILLHLSGSETRHSAQHVFQADGSEKSVRDAIALEGWDESGGF
jgi:hypothetical protein